MLQARVSKKAKKVIWEYNVKWKGYSTDENTQVLLFSLWEPITSFSGSEEIVERFWMRVDLGGRDIKNMTQFKVGETFVQVGPPRRKPSQRSVKADAASSSTPPVSAGPSTERPRAGKRRRSSPAAVALEETPAKRTRGRISESTARPAQETRAPREPPRRPPAKTTASSTRSIRRTKKRTPSPEVVPASEDEEDEEDVAMLVDPDLASFVEPPSQEATGSPLDEALTQAPTQPKQDHPSPLPSHRARAAKPLVKMVDDFTTLDGAISAKARLQGRNGTSQETPVAGPSSGSRRKPGPGRSSTGLLTKNTSSLLTFDKGALKTVKGKFAAPVDEEDNAIGTSPDPLLAVPPTSDELLELGGFDSKAADALDDFEDAEAVSSPTGVPESNPNQESLTLAKNKLFPPGTSMAASFSNVWRRTTIFGPLGLGSDAVAEPASESKPFSLKLDTTVNVPLDLTDVFQSLDTLVGENTAGPAGKFFTNANALKLLDTVRTGGPSARAMGELFTVMVGSVFLGFFSSETPLMQRLNLPSSLASLSDSIFVTQLHIENFTAYLDVADTADTSRW
ncbi:hypothetical protein DFH06DRAFT_1313627 [Mycena polygramma]|nr:hypothetical protein DFH06DRAFT_1313627 [Mycena polygramma]